MPNEFKKILENSFNTSHGMVRQAHHDEPGRFVFRQPTNQRQPGLTDDDEEEEPTGQIEKKENEEIARRKESLKVQANRANISEHAKEVIRRLLQKGVEPWEGEESNALEYQNKIADFLANDIDKQKEERFLDEVGEMEKDDKKWDVIFTVQRSIRKQIQELQYRTESYVEIIKGPKKKTEFESLLKQVNTLNRSDDSLDRSLKRKLHELMQPAAGSVLDQVRAKEIYEVDPLSDDLKIVMARHKDAIEGGTDAGKRNFNIILTLKKEEARIENQMKRLCADLDAIINKNLSCVRRKAAKEKVLEDDSRIVGITLKEGTEIEYSDADNLSLIGNRKTLKIDRITWGEHNIRNKEGKVIDVSLGAPTICLSNGAKLTLARFKKWVDAADAVEKINTIGEVERAAEFEAYGIHIEEGMMLAYPRRHREKSGEIKTTLMNVVVKEINHDTKRIRFDQPVFFNPGLSTDTADDLRESLTFGEFVRWKQRYEVEKSVGLDEVQKLLIKHNELENKFYGIEAKDNPPIMVEGFEELHYPDEEDSKYVILKVDADSVEVDAFGKMTYPEFFYWVKNNHVRRVLKQKSPEEVAAEEYKKQEEKRAKTHETGLQEAKKHAGKEQKERAITDAEKRAAGSPVETLCNIWFTTTFLSFKDIWNMGKEVVEFMKRKHDRRSKGRYSEVGSRLPWVLGTEFERVKQAAENEEAGKYKEAMEHWSIEKVKTTLHRTNTKDEAKACMQVLVHKGEMRWDDHELWDTLNRLTARYTLKGAELYIPHLENMPQGKSGENMALRSLDALYGEGTGNEWFMDNTSKYNSIKNNFEYEFKQLENDPKGTGGPAGELHDMLADWKAGKYVNPQKYEAMIDGAIKFGKMGAEAKMFYIIAGIVAKRGEREHGETLIHIDRVAELNSKWSNNFPLLDYFTQEEIKDYTLIDPKTGEYGKDRKFNMTDYIKWVHTCFPDDFEENKPGAQFSSFLWEKMIVADTVRTRMSKGIRNAENMDHDDAQLFVPPLTVGEIDQVTTGPTGQKKYFTNEGYANVYPGFNQYIVSLSYAIEDETDPEKREQRMVALRDGIGSFIRFDAIIDNRLLKEEGDRRARLDEHHFERHPVVDDCKLKVHRAQLRNLILNIGDAYGQDWRQWLYGEKTGSTFDPKEKQKQRNYEIKINAFKELIPQLLMQDKGAKAMEVIRKMRTKGATERKEDLEDSEALRGIPKSARPKRKKLAALVERGRRWELEHAAPHGSQGGH